MRRFALSSTALFALGLALPAHASVYLGNPKLGFHLDRSQGDLVEGSVVVDRLVVETCAGATTTYDLDIEVDPVVGHAVEIAGGDLCSATWHWSSDIVVDGDGAAGDFSVLSDIASTTVDLDQIEDATLPWTIISGQVEGAGPVLVTWFD